MLPGVRIVDSVADRTSDSAVVRVADTKSGRAVRYTTLRPI